MFFQTDPQAAELLQEAFRAGEDPRVEARMRMYGLKNKADVAVGSDLMTEWERHRLTAAELTIGVYPVSIIWRPKPQTLNPKSWKHELKACSALH